MVRTLWAVVSGIGKAAIFGVGLIVVSALLVGPIEVGLAAVGDPILAGKVNEAGTRLTALTANLAGPVLKLTNQGTGPALQLQVASGKAPLKVNASADKATNLKADKLDGKEASELGQMWAVVNYSLPACTLVRGSGAVATEGSGSFCGVTFERNVTNCAFIAGLSEPGTGYPGADRNGEVWAFVGDDASTIYVRTANSAGTKTPQPFHVAVFC